MNALQQIKSNPTQFLAQRGIQVPPNIANDPNAIIQHLMNTGKIDQQQYNNAVQMAQQYKI